MTIYAFTYSRGLEYEGVEAGFNRDAENYVSAIRQVVAINLHEIDALGALFDASYEVERGEFRTFTSLLLDDNPTVQALEWAPRITDDGRKAFEEKAKREGLRDFKITITTPRGASTEEGRRKEYFPIYYAEPYEGNESALGFDMASEPVRFAALDLARRTGKITTTGKILLAQEKEGQYGVLLIRPVYKKTVADTEESRLKNLDGFVVGALRVGDMLRRCLEYLAPAGIDIHVYDDSAPAGSRFLQYYPAAQPGTPPLNGEEYDEKTLKKGLHLSAGIDIADRRWLIYCTPAPGYVSSRLSSHPWVLLAGGLALTGFIPGFVFLILSRLSQSRRHAQEMLESKETLDAEVSERKRAEVTLAESEKKYRTLAEAARDAIFIIDKNNIFRYVNTHAAREFGLSPEDMVSRPIDDFFPPHITAFQRRNHQLISETKETLYREEKLSFPSGERWMGTSLVPLLDDKGEVEAIMGISRDITAHRIADEKINRLNRMYMVLSKTNETIIRTRDRDKLFQEVCRIAVEQGRFRMAWVGLVKPGESVVKPAAHYGFEDGYLSEILINIDDVPEGQGPTGKAIREGKYSICNDIEKDDFMLPWREKAIKRGYLSSASFPFKVGGMVAGTINLYSGERNFFDDDEIGLLNEMAEDVSFSLDFMRAEEARASAEESLIRRLELESAISEISAGFIGIFDIDEAINIALGKVGTFGGASRAYLFLFDYEREVMNNTHEWCAGGVAPQIETLKDIPLGSFPWLMEKLRTEGFVNIPDVSMLPAEAVKEKEEFERQNIKSLLLIPLRIDKELSGFMGFDNVTGTGLWDGKDMALLQLTSEIVGNALRQKKMEEAITQARQDWEETFNTITDMVTVHDKDFNIILANKSAEKILDLPALNVKRSKCYEYYHGTECPPEGCPSCKCFVTGKPAAMELYEPHLKMFVEIRAIPRFGEDGKIVGLIHIVRDIGERKKAEEKIGLLLEDITKAKNEWETTFDSVSELIVLINKDFDILRCNRAFSEYAGLPPDELVGRKCHEFLTPANPQQLEHCKVLIKDGTALPKTEVETETGHWFLLSQLPVTDENGLFLFSVITATNVTELKKAELRLIESENEMKIRVEELEKFYDMAVGRELRMKELKKSVERLEAERDRFKKGGAR